MGHTISASWWKIRFARLPSSFSSFSFMKTPSIAISYTQKGMSAAANGLGMLPKPRPISLLMLRFPNKLV